MRTRVAVVLVLLLGVLAGCRQAPLDPGFRPPDPDRVLPDTPAWVEFPVPDGFVESYDYQTEHHLFPAPVLTFLIPLDAVEQFDNLEVVTIASYLMDIDVTGWPEERLVEVVRRMVRGVGSPVVEPERTTVAGRPAFTLPVIEPARRGDPYTYQATFIFDGRYLVQTQCQYALRRELIEQACAALHESMEIVLTPG